MRTIFFKSLVRLRSKEIIFFISQAGEATKLLTEDVNADKVSKILKASQDYILAMKKRMPNGITDELNALKRKCLSNYYWIKTFVRYAQEMEYNNYKAELEAVQKALAKHVIHKADNNFIKMAKMDILIKDLLSLNPEYLVRLNIYKLVKKVSVHLSRYEVLYNERAECSETLKGQKLKTRNIVRKAWYEFVEYVNAVNIVTEGKEDDFIRVVNGLYDKALNLRHNTQERKITSFF